MKRGAKIAFGAVFAVLGFALAAAVAVNQKPEKSPLNIQTAPLAFLDGGETAFAKMPPAPRLVNFWATWCAPCVHEMPLLEEAARQNPAVHFSGVAVDHPDLIRPFLRKIPVTYDILTPKFDIFFLFDTYGNKTGALPYTLLLDEKGGILARKIGEFHSAEEINSFISGNLP